MEITIPRTGDAPLAFQGEEIGSVQTDQRPPSGRTVTITLYRLAHDRYVAHVHFTSMLGFEPDFHVGIGPQDSISQIAGGLRSIDPGNYMIPFKDTQIDQVKVMLRDKYLNAVSKLLTQFPQEV